MTEIITLALLKTYLGITDTSLDNKLTIIVNGVNQYILDYTKNNILAKDYVEVLPVTGSLIFASYTPVNSISELAKNIGVGMNEQFEVVDSSRYSLDKKPGIIDPMDKFYGRNAVRLTYNAGYAEIPEDLKLAGLEIAENIYKDESGVKKIETDGDSIEYKDIQEVLTVNNKRILDFYKIYTYYG